MSKENNTGHGNRSGMGFGRGGRMNMSGEKARNFKGTASRFLEETGHHKWRLLGVVLFAVISCLFSIAAPTVMGRAINVVEDGALNIINGTGGMDYTRLSQILAVLLALHVTSSLISYMQSFVVASVSTGISYEFRQK